jgi:hypothetical protein
MIESVRNMIKNLIIMTLFIFPCGEVLAQETRASMIRQIVEVQGVRQMFEEQYAQQRNTMEDQAKQLYTQIVESDGGKESEKSKEIFIRFMTKTSEMISVSEMTDRWISYYGTQLSDKDLRDILAYYKTETGKKDIAATRAAMTPFTAWLLQESQKRGEQLIAEFIQQMESIP